VWEEKRRGSFMMHSRTNVDMNAYIARSQSGPCFVCEIVRGNPQYRHHIIYQDEKAIAFLNKYPTLYGYAIVAPLEHREQVTEDFTEEEYLRLQLVIYRLAEIIRREVTTERVYILSLGSQQGNRHVHWHIAPLPPGVPYEQQQFEALSLEHGILNIPHEEMAELAARLRHMMEGKADDALE
jgi:diadenosine tetraphosphate (Ap4A) HIT family hydrolase